MGRDLHQITVTYSVSHHCSEQDIQDDAAAEDLRSQIENLICDPRYESLWPDVC